MSTMHGLIDLPDSQIWASGLKAIAKAPLQSSPDFPLIAHRFNAWWEQAFLDRPVFLATANSKPESPITRRIDLVPSPEEWLRAKLADMAQTVWFGDAVPQIRVDLGAACLGGLMGVPTDCSSDTTWTHACIFAEDWSDAPDSRLQGKWWEQLPVLLDLAANAAKGKFLVCTPSLGGLADVLTNLRGATEICMDVIEQPTRICSAIDQLFPLWQQAFQVLYDRILTAGAGLVHWHMLWSDVPYVVTECDLGYSISQEDYNKICLPDIARTAAFVGRSIFHLDGPGATRHVDSLLEIPEIRAIQYTPGAGSPSAMAWVDMFRKIQVKGRSLLIFAPADEVLPLMDALKPEGLAILVEGPASVDALQAIQGAIERRFGTHK